MAKFRIQVGDQVEEIPLGPALEVPIGRDPDIVIRLNTRLESGSMHCASCDRDYTTQDLEQQITGHFGERFAEYAVDADLADAMHAALEPWTARIQAGTLICFDCVATPNAVPH